MAITFYKYQGTGNDFVFIDNRMNSIQLNRSQISHMCDRKFGIGADGLILIENDEQADFRMVYYNADGGESTMCGNGGRCAVHFAYFLDIISHKCTFMAIDGLHQGEVLSKDRIKIKMADVDDIRHLNEDFVLNTGSPHLVRWVDNIMAIDVKLEGRKLRNGKEFVEEGINVNFISSDARGMEIATYERGVEDETLSCGTGVTAAAIIANHSKGLSSPIQVKSKGGNLKVSFEKSGDIYNHIWLEGPVSQVYKGIVET